jgi:hypothetical protein
MAGYALLADLIVVVHFLYVSFTVGGELLILIGGALRWAWTRNLTLRIAHLCSVVLVAAEALAGAACPLTVWEYRLRALAGQRVEAQISFVPRLVRRIIFYDFPAWVFVIVYVAFAAAVVLTFILLPPARQQTARRLAAPPLPTRPSAPREGPRSAGRPRRRKPD